MHWQASVQGTPAALQSQWPVMQRDFVQLQREPGCAILFRGFAVGF